MWTENIDFFTLAAASSSSLFFFSSCSRRDIGRWPMLPIAKACNFCSVIFYVQPGEKKKWHKKRRIMMGNHIWLCKYIHCQSRHHLFTFEKNLSKFAEIKFAIHTHAPSSYFIYLISNWMWMENGAQKAKELNFLFWFWLCRGVYKA